MTRDVYLLHFDPPYRHAAHYTGSTRRGRVMERWLEHWRGQGGRLCAIARAAGVRLRMARVWCDVPASFERSLKKRHGAWRFCPICLERKALERALRASLKAS